MTAWTRIGPHNPSTDPIRAAIDRYEDAHWPQVRQAWLNRWTVDKCMACGTPRRQRDMSWWARRRAKPLTVHHARYPHAWIAGEWRKARGADELDTDLIELCPPCHLSGRLAGHHRGWDEMRLWRETWRQVRRRRRRHWWRNPPTPAWAWNR